MGLVKTIRRSLSEAVNATGSHRVDRASRVIRHVKLLGKSSPNRHGLSVQGTDYSDAALDRAVPMYEGRKVYIAHNRANPSAERPLHEMAGVIRQPVRESDGLYGDFHYRSQHSYLADDAEQMSESFGFSHNATGSGCIRGGRYVIESVESVRSVDIVTDPATTKGLFESEGNMPTIKQVIDGMKFDAKITKRVLEIDGMDGAAPMPAIGGESDESAEVHMGRAILAIINDSSLDAGGKKKKVLAALKLLDDDASGSETETETDTTSSDTSTESDDKKPTFESLQRDLQKLRDKNAIRDLCESKSFKPTALQLEAIEGLPAAKREAYIKESIAGASAQKGPRSSSPQSLQESSSGGGAAAGSDSKAAAGRWLS